MSAQLQEGNTQAKMHEFEESAKGSANAAHDTTTDASGQAQAQAHRAQEETAGILQQTGQQAVNLAQGAIDGVKNTLGLGDKK